MTKNKFWMTWYLWTLALFLGGAITAITIILLLQGAKIIQVPGEIWPMVGLLGGGLVAGLTLTVKFLGGISEKEKD